MLLAVKTGRNFSLIYVDNEDSRESKFKNVNVSCGSNCIINAIGLHYYYYRYHMKSIFIFNYSFIHRFEFLFKYWCFYCLWDCGFLCSTRTIIF